MLIGVLVDVSGSMREKYKEKSLVLNYSQVTKFDSVFKTLLNMAEEQKHLNLKMVALGFGFLIDGSINIYDILKLISLAANSNLSTGLGDEPDFFKKKVIELLAENGAPYCQYYVNKYVIEQEAKLLYILCKDDPATIGRVIKALPISCREPLRDVTFDSGLLQVFSKVLLSHDAAVARVKDRTLGLAFPARESRETRHNVEMAMEIVLQPASEYKIHDGEELKNILSSIRQGNSEQTLDQRIAFMIESIEPIIYGATPMYTAISDMLEILKSEEHENVQTLFIITDGEWTDRDPLDLITELCDMNVLVFVAILTLNETMKPRQLCDSVNQLDSCNVDEFHKRMFDMSSSVPNSHPAFSVLVDRGWKLGLSGESRLFLQVNNAEILDEFASCVKQMNEDSNVLFHIFARVDLEEYINSQKASFKPNEQIGGTCYANAIAAVYHMATRRVHGRVGGYPEFQDKLRCLVNSYGMHGANTEKVLSDTAKLYRLRYKSVSEDLARHAINCRRPIVARYCLYKNQRDEFSSFYKKKQGRSIDEQAHIVKGARKPRWSCCCPDNN